MFVKELFEEFAREERRVAAEHHDRALLIFEQRSRHLHGMARAELLLLRDELGLLAKLFQRLAHALPAEARNDNLALCASSLCSVEHLLDHGLAACLVQDFWELRLHARTLAGREDDGDEI